MFKVLQNIVPFGVPERGYGKEERQSGGGLTKTDPKESILRI